MWQFFRSGEGKNKFSDVRVQARRYFLYSTSLWLTACSAVALQQKKNFWRLFLKTFFRSMPINKCIIYQRCKNTVIFFIHIAA